MSQDIDSFDNLNCVIITGATGQDGKLASSLLSRLGKKVVGLARTGRSTPPSDHSIKHWEYWDWNSQPALEQILEKVSPQAVLHLAAHHHHSTAKPNDLIADEREMIQTNVYATSTLILAMQRAAPKAQIISAASSQMYTPDLPGTRVGETSIIHPSTLYGVTKSSVLQMVKHYREDKRLQGGSAILFNHESSYRPERFVTRTISKAVAAIAAGLRERLVLNNIGVAADWFAAEDAVRAMLLMADQGCNCDYVIASGHSTSLKELLNAAFSAVDLDWRDYVESKRDEGQPYLVGDTSRINAEVGWYAQKSIQTIMKEMVLHDQAQLENH